jgi:hypothetical protein
MYCPSLVGVVQVLSAIHVVIRDRICPTAPSSIRSTTTLSCRFAISSSCRQLVRISIQEDPGVLFTPNAWISVVPPRPCARDPHPGAETATPHITTSNMVIRCLASCCIRHNSTDHEDLQQPGRTYPFASTEKHLQPSLIAPSGHCCAPPGLFTAMQ